MISFEVASLRLKWMKSSGVEIIQNDVECSVRIKLACQETVAEFSLRSVTASILYGHIM